MLNTNLRNEQWIEISQVLSFFSSVYFKEPTAAYCQMLPGLFDSEWNFEFQSKDAEFSYTNLQSIKEYNLTNMIVEYNKLFVSGQPILTPPWASIYLNKNGEVFDDETIDVRNFYKKCGLSYENILREPEDHMGLELIFCSYMASKADELDFQLLLMEFLEQHLIPWCDYFFGIVSMKSSHEFYQNISTLTNDYMKYLVKILDLKPKDRTIYDHYQK